jgi:hypothetical protein
MDHQNDPANFAPARCILMLDGSPNNGIHYRRITNTEVVEISKKQEPSA